MTVCQFFQKTRSLESFLLVVWTSITEIESLFGKYSGEREHSSTAIPVSIEFFISFAKSFCSFLPLLWSQPSVGIENILTIQ